MKLHIVPARQGILWVKLGMRTFFRQPLALTGLFFIFMAVMSVISMVPVIGNVLALALLPGATLGLMVATQEALKGQFPMPSVLIAGFRAGRAQMRAMLILGALYALGFVSVLGLSALADGGKFAQMYLFGGAVGSEVFQDPAFETATMVALLFYMPLSLLFWFAPALVYWNNLSPMKSLFFSMVACIRNIGAFTVYSLVWMLAFMVIGLGVVLVAGLSGSEDAVALVLYPTAMVMAAMFFSSIYFTYADSFSIPSVHLA
jgi:hypothetical protein